jgi:hypothetical protein
MRRHPIHELPEVAVRDVDHLVHVEHVHVIALGDAAELLAVQRHEFAILDCLSRRRDKGGL